MCAWGYFKLTFTFKLQFDWMYKIGSRFYPNSISLKILIHVFLHPMLLLRNLIDSVCLFPFQFYKKISISEVDWHFSEFWLRSNCVWHIRKSSGLNLRSNCVWYIKIIFLRHWFFSLETYLEKYIHAKFSHFFILTKEKF